MAPYLPFVGSVVYSLRAKKEKHLSGQRSAQKEQQVAGVPGGSDSWDY